MHVKFARLVSGATGEAPSVVGGSGAGRGEPEPGRAEPARAEPGRAEPGRGEGGRGEGGHAHGGSGGGGGVRAKVRARVAAVARADAGADREFMGNLVRAVAALADRVDEITKRLGDLELLVEDVVDRLSEDLVRVQAALGALDGPETPDDPRAHVAEPRPDTAR
ncbi:MAG: hypothetical protein ACP5PM_09175 [Acidimicrobiales bacterium]